MTSKETFSGFITKYRNKYRRSKTNGQPVTSNFYDCFFGCWSSSMKIDFRETCHWCGDDSAMQQK